MILTLLCAAPAHPTSRATCTARRATSERASSPCHSPPPDPALHRLSLTVPVQTPPGHASPLQPSQASLAKPGRVMYLIDAMDLALTDVMNLTHANLTIAKHEICQQSRDEAACEEIYESGIEAGEKSIIKLSIVGSMLIVTCIAAAISICVQAMICYCVCYWVCYGGFKLGKAALRMIRERRAVPSPLIQPKPWPAMKLSF